jgi:MarR family transcriptional regulator, organic hydroperoxide resistance regulator
LPSQRARARSRTDELNAEIQECVFELTGRMIGQAERLAQAIGIPDMCMKALHMLDAPMAMKELARKFHCDPSFVTSVADMLEKRGLARREPHPSDRRVKNLVLTRDGCSMRKRVEVELMARMPWTRGLTDDERVQLLALIRKMLSVDMNSVDMSSADAGAGDSGPGDPATEAASTPVSLEVTPSSQKLTSAGVGNPPAPTGEVEIGAVAVTR